MIGCTYLIDCDSCGNTITSDHSADVLEAQARAAGWQLADVDRCPTCAPPAVWTLVERAQAGEAEAFSEIYSRYLDVVFRFVYYRVGNRQLAEDLTADTFTRALKNLGTFTWQGRDPAAWLITIARNLVADHYKSSRYRLEVICDDPGGGLHYDVDTSREGSPEQAAVDYLTDLALLRAVQQLSPDQRECIILRYLYGYSVAETAAAMGSNVGAVKALAYRAIRALGRLAPELGDGRPPRTGTYIPAQQRRDRAEVMAS